MRRCIKIICAVLFSALMWSCGLDEQVSGAKRGKKEKMKIAVVLPTSEGNPNWQRTLDMVKCNLSQATDEVEPEFELYDEDNVNIEQLAADLAVRKDLTAVVGCYNSDNTDILARECSRTAKALFTFSTSDDLPRAHGKNGYVWFLAESDITQCELLLVKAYRQGGRRVALLCCSNIYGETFSDWFGYQSAEIGLEPTALAIYKDSDLQTQFNIAAKDNPDYIICVAASAADACEIINIYRESDFGGRLLFSDSAYTPFLVASGARANGIEGIAPCADPTSGFNVSYNALTGEKAYFGEAYLYDAVAVACMAYRHAQLHSTSVNEAVGSLLRTSSDCIAQWTDGALADIFDAIEAGATPGYSGASGPLEFDPDGYNMVRRSAYVHWMAYDGELIPLDYDNRSEESSMLAAWEYRKSAMQEFDNDDNGVSYPDKSGNYAVVVAASQGWENFRHQADALAFYQLLKTYGYDDDHIMLLMADDIAYSNSNPEQGVIRRVKNGPNLYQDVVIDYRLSELDTSQLLKLFEDVPTGEGDNILFFWSGHGLKGSLEWGESFLYGNSFAETVRRLNEQQKYRKMLCFIETCYSGSVAQNCVGIPGILLFTATNGWETSKADNFDPDLGIWTTNRFTSVLLSEISTKPEISLRDLYLSMFHGTLGSHVSVYNAAAYGSVYANTLREYLN